MKKLSLLSILLGIACLVPMSLSLAGEIVYDYQCYPFSSKCGNYSFCTSEFGECPQLGSESTMVNYNHRISQTVIVGNCFPEQDKYCEKDDAPGSNCYDFYYLGPIIDSCNNIYLVCEQPNGETFRSCGPWPE